MLKHLLRMIASSITFVALLLFANIAIASPQTDNISLETVNQTSSSLVNLNVISSSLEFNSQCDRPSLDNLGCSCAVCTQAVQ